MFHAGVSICGIIRTAKYAIFLSTDGPWVMTTVHMVSPCSKLCNLQGALFPDVIDSHLSAETGQNAVIGPFSVSPFSCWVALSPLNSVPKQDSSERYIIVDFSWPVATSVNDGNSSSRYLGHNISLTYPTVNNIASLIWSTGAGCLIYKHDLRRAYRQFPVDPMGYILLRYC